jgi:multiple sugar transport system substrate-binding protein
VLKNEAVRKEFGKGTPFKDKNLQSVFYYKFAPISPKTIYDSVAEKSYRKDIVNMIMGKTDINSAFRAAEEETNKAIAAAKSK